MQTPQQGPVLESSAQELARLPNHFTASGILIAFDHILLVHHKRIGAWLPPGGHIEAGEYPHEACVREVFEETGLKVTVSSTPVPETLSTDAFFPPQPLCLHIVKAAEKGIDCFHLDLAYICQATPAFDSLPALSQGEEECRWVALNRLSELVLAKNVTELVQLALAKFQAGMIS
jgi:8-oxo-dGTP pyrophosphatase MutT (NUDIX family)